MKVAVKLYGALKVKGGTAARVTELPEGATLLRLLDVLRSEYGQAVIDPDRLVLMVNQKRAGLETTLNEGDEVSVFRLLGGGASK